MVMTDSNEQLLKEFFRPMAELQIEDNGFTERVMNSLPERQSLKWSRLWTMFCVVSFVVLFFLLNGFETVFAGLLAFLRTAPTEFNPMMAFASIAGLVIAFCSEWFYSSRKIAI